MIACSLGLFLLLVLVITLPLGFQGFQHLGDVQKLWYYGAVLLGASIFSVSTVHQIIPASKIRVNASVTIASAFALLAIVVIGIFPNAEIDHFVRTGISCLRLGSFCAVIGGFLAYRFIRNGYAISPLQLAVTTGCFAGLSGVAVLALHCTIQDVAHVIVWHLSVPILGGLVGAGIWRIHSARQANLPA